MAIVCHCEGVRGRPNLKAIHRGATTLADVHEACGAGTRCGGCIPAILDLLVAHDVRVADEQRPLRWAESTA